MKKRQIAWGVLLTLCLNYALEGWAQQPLKPRIQTSASPEETVFKPAGQKESIKETPSKDAVTVKKGKAVAVKKEKATTPKDKRKENTSSDLSSRYWALKTNLPADIFAIHNLAIEMQISQKLSIELPVYWSLWEIEQEHGIRGVGFQPEVRWWTDAAGKGHYVGCHAHVAWYNIKWNENRYQDTGRPLLGAGLSYGYKLPLTEHWGAEFTLGLGYTNLKYNVYYNLDNGAKIDSRIRHYWGLTRIGASLVYCF